MGQEVPWRRKWQPTPVFLPEKSHGQRNLVGNSPWGCKESNMTEHIPHTHTHTTKSVSIMQNMKEHPRAKVCLFEILENFIR